MTEFDANMAAVDTTIAEMAKIAISETTPAMKEVDVFQPFRFLDLPFDLRLDFYDFLLGARREYLYVHISEPDHPDTAFCPNSPYVNLEILLTCRQIYHEAYKCGSRRPVSLRVCTHDERVLENLGNLDSLSMARPAAPGIIGNAYFRSSVEHIQLNLEYRHGHNSERQYSRLDAEQRANQIFVALPSLKVLEIIIYGSKGHGVLMGRNQAGQIILRNWLRRLIGSIPGHVKIILSDQSLNPEVTILNHKLTRHHLQQPTDDTAPI